MRPNCENHKFITTLALSFLLISTVSQQPSGATAALDNEGIETGNTINAPLAVPVETPAVNSDSSEDAVSTPKEPVGSETFVQNDRPPIAPGAGQQTYSIRLPLGVAGSVLPKLESGKPALPASGSIMPRQNVSDAQDFNRPVAWRATAEAIRTQPAGPALQIATIGGDFKTTYSTIFREAPAAGWNLASLSLPAGHFLIRIPKSNASEIYDDAAAWLVVLLSPIDSNNTEIRVKIQTRRPSTYAAAVANFIKRCQMQATGNELL